MLVVEPTQLLINKYDKTKNLRLINKQTFPVIYKVKTSNKQVLNVMNVNLTSGRIQPEEQREISFKIICDRDFEAKIQVSCVNVSGKQGSAESIWQNAEKAEISNIIVKIRKKVDLEVIKEEDNTSKFSQASQMQPKLGTTLIQEESVWQKKYQEEVSSCNRLKQKLDITEKKLAQALKATHQSRINYRLKNGQEEYYQVTLNNILLTCLLFFILGYVFARLY